MIKARGKTTNTLYLILGFVGEAGGPVRAVCVEPLGGNAKIIGVHELSFDPMTEKMEPKDKGKSFSTVIHDELPPNSPAWKSRKK